MANTYDTSAFPLGSKDPRVLYNNASNLDEAVNAFVLTWVDRFGRPRKTFYGMESDFTNMLASFGYEPTHLIYTDGQPLQVSRPTQLIDRAGSIYRVKMPATFPVSLTGSWASDSTKLVDVGDQSLRTELAGTDGYSLVGGVLSFDEQLIPAPVAGSSLTRGVVHAMYREGAEVGALRAGGSDLTSLNDERNFWRGLPSQNAWGDPANIGFCSAAFNRNGASFAAYSTTFGHGCVTYGTASIAFGAGSCAGNPDLTGTPDAAFTGYCSIAGGKNVYVPGQKAAAFGEEHFVDTRAGMAFGYTISTQPSSVEENPVGAAGIGREIKLYGQSYGFGAYISASDGMAIGYGANPGSPLHVTAPGEVGIGNGTTDPALRIGKPTGGGVRSPVMINRIRPGELPAGVTTVVELADGATFAITGDGFGVYNFEMRGLKTDGTSQSIVNFEWANPNGGSAVGELNVRMNGRTTSAFALKPDGTPVFAEMRAEGTLNYPVLGALYYTPDGTVKRRAS